MSSLIVYGFTAGAVATVNPRGFALLLAWFARAMADYAGRPAVERLVRGTVSGSLVSLGFVTIFAIAGVILGSGASWLGPALPWIGTILGLGLALIGASVVFGLRFRALPGMSACRRVNARYGAFGFGLSYGVASISCTLPIFMSVVGLSFLSESNVSLAGFLAFLAGAASVLSLVAVGGTALGTGVSRLVQGRAMHLRRLSGGLTLVAGLYIALYWGRLFLHSTPRADGIADLVGTQAAAASAFLSSGPGAAALALAAAIVSGTAWILHRLGSGRPSPRGKPDTGDARGERQ